jgi:hypothetical protein
VTATVAWITRLKNGTIAFGVEPFGLRFGAYAADYADVAIVAVARLICSCFGTMPLERSTERALPAFASAC